MLDQVLNLFNIVPEYDLNIMDANQSLFDVTATVVKKTGEILEKENPDIMIVQGDTTTTFAASLAAYYTKVRIGHVEAGLRTYNKYNPFPEEMNRRLTSSLADIHFAATEEGKRNLLMEGIGENDIVVTGNTVVDSLLWIKSKIDRSNKKYEALKGIDFNKKIILVTGHRRENFGNDIANICRALKNIANENQNVEIVYPVHLNPNVRRPANRILGDTSNIKLIEPLRYEEFIFLASEAKFIISDSGGIQEEAPTLGKNVLLTRKVTERPEAVQSGAVKLVGVDEQVIFEEANKLIHEPESYKSMAKIKNPFGDGRACERIIEGLKGFLYSNDGSKKRVLLS